MERPLKFTLQELEAMPQISIEAMLECAGNSSAKLETQVEGLQWDCGAVGNAVWNGVLLKTILEKAYLKNNVVDLVFEGLDHGKISASGAPDSEVIYARSIPVEVFHERKPLTALKMNGEPLSADHGCSARLIVPG